MSKITVDKLDPTKKVARVHISSEHPDPLYFDKDNKRIAHVEIEEDYKPEYDFETENIKHWFYRQESTLYRDVNTLVGKFRSRWTAEKYAKALFYRWVIR